MSRGGVGVASLILEHLQTEVNVFPSSSTSTSIPVPVEIPVTVQPAKTKSPSSEIINNYCKDSVHNSSGISDFSSIDIIVIDLEQDRAHCDWSTKYSVKNGIDQKLLFQAVEDFHCFFCDNLQNVVIRDLESTAVARVCFKEKSCLFSSLVLAVYFPPHVLVGTAEESPRCFMSSAGFKIRNSDGDNLFHVVCNRSLCSSTSIKIHSTDDNEIEVAKILERSDQRFRLQFMVKMSVTSKLVLLGFCIGTLHKYYMRSEERTR